MRAPTAFVIFRGGKFSYSQNAAKNAKYQLNLLVNIEEIADLDNFR